ncbi:MAG: type II toxin-antitoxin system HicA family toxin [Candidatus Eremiobacteraeota bacterium]|nr:type II toxin-antitoxin system HicA family toxin [Candidatus Eremiobacteraeota bacterium]
MSKRFKNSKEIIRALKKQGWKRKITSKKGGHSQFIHYLYKCKLSVPREHGYITMKTEMSVIKAMYEVEEKLKEGK